MSTPAVKYRPKHIIVVWDSPADCEVSQILADTFKSLQEYKISSIKYVVADDGKTVVRFTAQSQLYYSRWRDILHQLYNIEIKQDETDVAMAKYGKTIELGGVDVCFDQEQARPVKRKKIVIPVVHKPSPEAALPQITSAKDSYRPEMTSIFKNGQMRPAMVYQTKLAFTPADAAPDVQPEESKPKDQFKKPADPESQAKPEKPVPPPIVLAPPFEVSANHIEDVKSSLYDRTCIANVYDMQRGDESAADFYKRSKNQKFVVPKFMSSSKDWFPPIVKHLNKYTIQIVDLKDQHVSDLAYIKEWFRSPGWEGVFALYPVGNMCGSNYIIWDEPTPCFPFLEAHRRALAVEDGVSKATAYLYEVAKRADTFKAVPPKYLLDAYDLLTEGAGLNGSGPDFWKRTADEAIFAVFMKLKNSGKAGKQASSSGDTADGCVSELSKLLSSTRANAFTARYPVGTVLSWGLPLLGLMFEMRDLLMKLDVESNAAAVRKILVEETKLRKDLYMRCMEPLLVYGGHISKLLRVLEDVCLAFRELGDSLGVTFPSGIKQVHLTSTGYMVGISGQRLALGQFDTGAPRGIIPFPSSFCCIKQLSDEEIWKLANEQYAREDGRIKKMVEACGSLDDKSVFAAEMMRVSEKRIFELMMRDSHLHRRTSILQPTSSMPDAVYSPEKIFAPQ